MGIEGKKISALDGATRTALRRQLEPIDITYEDLVTTIQASELITGALYRITDYQTIHYILDGDGDICLDGDLNPVVNTATVEPLVVTASGSNTLAPGATSELYPQDILHYDWNPDNWKYDLAFAAWDEAVLTGFKGVIYFRHDTLNDVSMGHDWRKVLNRRWKFNYPIYDVDTTYAANDKVQVDGDGVYVSMKAANTGNAVSDAEWWIKIIDYSITEYWSFKLSISQDEEDYIDVPCFYSQEDDPEDQYKREVLGVHLKPFKDDGVDWGYYWNASILQNNVFVLEPDHGWYQVLGISAEAFCTNNTFEGYQEANFLGASFCDNSIGSAFYNNSIGSYCRNNSIGSDFYNNSISSNCWNNSIGSNFYNNSIGSDFYNNSIGSDFYNNSIGSNFYNNSIGSNFYNNSIGNNVRHLFTPNKIEATAFRNNVIRDGVQGSDGSPLDFTSATHVFLEYNCEIYKRPDGTVRLKYMNDSDASVVVNYNA